jgi:hypothetical protein
MNHPTTEQNKALVQAFDFINEKIFEAGVSTPMIIFTRNANSIGGYFTAKKWHNEIGEEIHEIAINANSMRDDIVELMGTLIHEMVHLWQQDHGTPGRGGYHNKEWAAKAKEIGLIPKDTKTGKETGDSISTELTVGGLAEKVIADMPEEIILPWMAEAISGLPENGNGGGAKPPEASEKKKNSSGRSKYKCPVCFLNAWAKPGASIICGSCDKLMIEQQ